MWNEHRTWEEAETKWDEEAKEASKKRPIKTLKKLPEMPGITDKARKHLRWKALRWLIRKDPINNWCITKGFFRHPFKYTFNYVKSLWKKKPFKREGDLYFYQLEGEEAFKEALLDPNSLLLLGFSYCQKPFECPSGRFTRECVHDLDNPVCRQCFIGKCVHAAPEKQVVPLFLTTVHHLGEELLEALDQYPDKRVLFLITTCEMMLEMFADWSNMADVEGIGVRIDGRICNTMEAFDLSERGIKPGLTLVLPETEKKMLELIRHRRETFQ